MPRQVSRLMARSGGKDEYQKGMTWGASNEDEHEKFINSMTMAKRAKMLADLCEVDSDESLVVKGIVIATATWQKLTRVESKEKCKGRVKDSMKRPRAAKFVPTTPMPIESMALLSKVLQNQETNLHKIVRAVSKSITLWHYINSWNVALRETLASPSPRRMPTFPTFLVELFAGSTTKLGSPAAYSSTPFDATVHMSPVHDESANTDISPESENTTKKNHVVAPATPDDSANSLVTSEQV
ncbi:hypothetical protein V6N11_022082 [Hibiscus sabdariffa]|uniref:Uncharacterized protein n=1 Tax=Hibiscus sabdariffa TaxID=183260 RepID=A0ABR2TII6_9ROSI